MVTVGRDDGLTTTIGTIRPKNFFEVTIGIKTDLNLIV